MTAEPQKSPPADNGCIVKLGEPVAAAEEEDDDHRSSMLSVKRDVDPWLLPQLDEDDSPRWKGTDHHHHHQWRS